jgi:hypothetical protein
LKEIRGAVTSMLQQEIAQNGELPKKAVGDRRGGDIAGVSIGLDQGT